MAFYNPNHDPFSNESDLYPPDEHDIDSDVDDDDNDNDNDNVDDNDNDNVDNDNDGYADYPVHVGDVDEATSHADLGGLEMDLHEDVDLSEHHAEDATEDEEEEDDDDADDDDEEDDDDDDDDSEDDYDGNKNPSSSSDSRSSSNGHAFDSKLESELFSDAIPMSGNKDPKLISKINVIDEHSSYKIRGLTTTDSKRSEATSSSGHFSSEGAIKTRSEMMLDVQQSNNLISDMTMFDLQDELEDRSKLNSKRDEDKSDAKIPRSQIDSEAPMQMKSNSNEFDEQNRNEIDAKDSDNSYQDELSDSDRCSDNSTLESDVEDINHALRLMTATRELIRSSSSSGHVSDSFDHSSHPDEIDTDVIANRRSSTGGESIESVFNPSKAKALIAKRSLIIQADEDTISASLHGVNDEGHVYNSRGKSEENNVIENSIPSHDNGYHSKLISSNGNDSDGISDRLVRSKSSSDEESLVVFMNHEEHEEKRNSFRANELSSQSSSESPSSDEEYYTPLNDATKMTHQIDDEVEPKSAPDLFIDSDIALLRSQMSQSNASLNHSFPNGSRLYHQDSTDNAFNAYAQSSENESDGLLLLNREGISSDASSASSRSSSNKTYNYDKAYELNASNSDWYGNSNDGRDQVQGDSSDSNSDQSSDDYGVYSNREPSRTSFSDTSSLAQSLTSLEKTFSVSKYTSGHSSSSEESDDAPERSIIECNSFPDDRIVGSEEYETSSAKNELSASQFEAKNNIMHSSTRHERLDNQIKVNQEAEDDRTRTDNNDLITSQKKEESQSLGTIVEESPSSAKDRVSKDLRNNGANDNHLLLKESEESSERNNEWTDIPSRSDTWSAMEKVPEPVVIIPLNTTNFLLRRTFLSDRVLNSHGAMNSYKDRTYSRRRSNSYENIQVTEFCSKEDGIAVDNKFIRSQSDEYVDCARGSKARAAALFRMMDDVSEKVQNANGSKTQTMAVQDKAANEREVDRDYNSSRVPIALVECSDTVDRNVGESTFSHFSSEAKSHEDLDSNNHVMHSIHSKDDEVSTPTTLPSTIQKFDDEDAGYMPWPGENSVSSNGSQEEQSLAPQNTEDESSGGSFVEFWPNRGANIDLAMKHSQVQDQINPKKVPLNVPCSRLSGGDEKDSHIEVKEDGIDGALSEANHYEIYQNAMPAKKDQSDSSRSDQCSDIVSANCDEDILRDSNGSFSNADSAGRNSQNFKESSGVNQLSYDHVPVLSDAEIDKETSEDFCEISTSSHLKEEEEGRKFEHVQLISQGRLLEEKSQAFSGSERNISVDVKEALSESTDDSLAHHITVESEVEKSDVGPENTTIDPNTAFSEDFLPPTLTCEEEIDAYLRDVHDLPIHEHLKLDNELRDMILKIDPSIPKYIFTASVREHAERCLKALGIEDLFVDIIDVKSCNLNTKHARESFEAAMRIAGVTDPEGCIFLDDSTTNIKAARSVGWRSFLVGTVGRDCGKTITSEHAEQELNRIHDLPEILPEIFL
uniref:Uncharacterized protein n=1 Tax=Chaetoceros debilis TaxID=122233 RepID=A0A7S3VD64_9STRA